MPPPNLPPRRGWRTYDFLGISGSRGPDTLGGMLPACVLVLGRRRYKLEHVLVSGAGMVVAGVAESVLTGV